MSYWTHYAACWVKHPGCLRLLTADRATGDLATVEMAEGRSELWRKMLAMAAKQLLLPAETLEAGAAARVEARKPK